MGAAQGLDEAGKLEDLDVGGTVGPVVVPADDYVAAGYGMAVVAEIATLKFKFEVHALPALRPDLAFRLAIGETGLNGFDHVAQIFGEHPKKEHDALFVDRFVAQGREVQGLPGRGAFL